MDRYQRLMLAHGMLVILVAMLAGYMLMFKLLQGFQFWPGAALHFDVFGSEAGWVRAHSGGTQNGLLVMVVGLALPKLNLSEQMQRYTAWGFIYVAWSFTIFYWLGNAAGNRALSLGDNALGEADLWGVLGFLPGVPSVVIVPVLLAIGAAALLRNRS